MATTFLEPGGDADFAVTTTNGFWSNAINSPVISTDFVHGNHIKSIKYSPGVRMLSGKIGVIQDTGSRISFYIYLVTLPNSTATILRLTNNLASFVVGLKLTTGGVLQLFENTNKIGGDGATLSTGVWYRISLAYIITNTTDNRFEVFKDGVQTISVTNATITSTGTDRFFIGNENTNATLDFRSSDHYVDDSSSLTDTGDIWVTAKRPNANGTTNGFTTQIGSGGSGYSSGHSPQVNERPLSTTNGWSMVGAGSAVTEEYNIESKSTGDFDLTNANIVDYIGWVSASSLVSETASIIVNGASSNISLTSTPKVFTKVAGSTSYPAGTGTDIGITTDTTLTTVSLYECGILVAFKPGNVSSWLTA